MAVISEIPFFLLFRKAIRATVVLFPLLGITNLFFVIEPQGSMALRDAYHISNAILHSSQVRCYI